MNGRALNPRRVLSAAPNHDAWNFTVPGSGSRSTPCGMVLDLRPLGCQLKIAVNEATSEKADELLREYRLSHGLLIAGSLIAATAIIWNCPLASKNQRDYRFIAELNLLLYP